MKKTVTYGTFFINDSPGRVISLISVFSTEMQLSNYDGGFLVPLISNRIGPKYSIIVGSVPYLVANLLLIFASNFWMIIAGRALCGLSSSLLCAIISVYAAEIASTEVRGTLGVIIQINIAIGFIIMVAVGPYVTYFTVHIMFILFNVTTTVPIFFVPDSPYFLFTKGRFEESLQVLTLVRGSTELAYGEIETYTQLYNERKNKKKIEFSRTFIKATVILTVLILLSQLSGISCVNAYGQIIFESTQTSVSPEFSMVFLGFISMSAVIVTVLAADRFGRKPLLCYSSIGIGLGIFGLGAFFKIKESNYEISGFMNYVPLISLVLVVFCYNAGFGSVQYCLVPELYDGPARNLGITIFNLNIHIVSFSLVKCFPYLCSFLGSSGTYWFFGLSCIINCLFVKFFLPETKGKTFSKIQETLGTDNLKCDQNKENVTP